MVADLDLRLSGIVPDISQYLAQVFPIDVPVLVGVKPAEGAGELLDEAGRERLVTVHAEAVLGLGLEGRVRRGARER